MVQVTKVEDTNDIEISTHYEDGVCKQFSAGPAEPIILYLSELEIFELYIKLRELLLNNIKEK